MHLSIATEALFAALRRARGIAEKKTTMPILRHVLLRAVSGQLTVSAFDEEVAVAIEKPATVKVPGAYTLPGKQFFELVKSLPTGGETELQLAGKAVEVRCGSSSFKLPGLPADDFPPLPKGDSLADVELDAKVLAALIRRVVWAVHDGIDREFLRGALLEASGGKITMVALTGNRMALATAPVAEGFRVERGSVVPTKALHEIRKALEEEGAEKVKLAMGPGSAVVKLPGLVLMLRLIDGRDFPAYEQILKQLPSRRLEVERAGLVDAMKRAALFADDVKRAAEFSTSGDSLELRTDGSQKGGATEALKVKGEGQFRFSVDVALAALEAFDAETLVIGTGVEPTEPMVFRPAGDAADHLAILPTVR